MHITNHPSARLKRAHETTYGHLREAHLGGEFPRGQGILLLKQNHQRVGLGRRHLVQTFTLKQGLDPALQSPLNARQIERSVSLRASMRDLCT